MPTTARIDKSASHHAPLRSAQQVMRLSHLGAMMPTRLSFMRSLLRRLAREGATLSRPVWDMNEEGFGRAVYQITLAGHVYSLVAISADLPPEERTDRVIARAWDAAFVLYDGVPDAAELDRIAANAPRQEAGQFCQQDLVLSRANKSIRLFRHVVERLKAGAQPDPEMIRNTGYLMRTTAVYGNGKFGIADRDVLETRDGLSGPFAAEMLTVWMIRNFTHDLVEHLGGAKIARDLKRHLGIGNSTGLGMAPFLVSHPMLLNNWMMVLETARARALARPSLSKAEIAQAQIYTARISAHLMEWSAQTPSVDPLRLRWEELHPKIEAVWHQSRPLDALCALDDETDIQAILTALAIELSEEEVDGLTECMGATAVPRLQGAMRATDLAELIDTHMGWVNSVDFAAKEQSAQFWYVSEEKLEPRLGNRYEEPGAERESPLDIARRIQALRRALPDTDISVARFLTAHPEHRFAARRVQMLPKFPYAEIQDNLIAATTRPVDMLRAKLSVFGAAKFDPRSDRWVRVTLAQGAPLPDELTPAQADGWWLAALPT